MTISKDVNLEQLVETCKTCSLAHLCLPRGLSKDDMGKLDNLIKRKILVNPKEHLYRTGDPFRGLFAVRSGAFKAYRIDEQGSSQIASFYLPGEMMGFEALHLNQYSLSVVALNTSRVCQIPLHNLLLLSQSLTSLQRQLLNFMSQAMTQLMNRPTVGNAEQRLAVFLLDISNRYHQQGLSAQKFYLPMSRQDMASYLNLAAETVSRGLWWLQKQDYISINHRLINIVDLVKLQSLAFNTSSSS